MPFFTPRSGRLQPEGRPVLRRSAAQKTVTSESLGGRSPLAVVGHFDLDVLRRDPHDSTIAPRGDRIPNGLVESPRIAGREHQRLVDCTAVVEQLVSRRFTITQRPRQAQVCAMAPTGRASPQALWPSRPPRHMATRELQGSRNSQGSARSRGSAHSRGSRHPRG